MQFVQPPSLTASGTTQPSSAPLPCPACKEYTFTKQPDGSFRCNICMYSSYRHFGFSIVEENLNSPRKFNRSNYHEDFTPRNFTEKIQWFFDKKENHTLFLLALRTFFIEQNNSSSTVIVDPVLMPQGIRLKNKETKAMYEGVTPYGVMRFWNSKQNKYRYFFVTDHMFTRSDKGKQICIGYEFTIFSDNLNISLKPMAATSDDIFGMEDFSSIRMSNHKDDQTRATIPMQASVLTIITPDSPGLISRELKSTRTGGSRTTISTRYSAYPFSAGLPLEKILEKKTLTTEHKIAIIEQLYSVLKQIFAQNLVHGDLSTNNVIVNFSANGQVTATLIDTDGAYKADDMFNPKMHQNQNEDFAGTSPFRPKEMISNNMFFTYHSKDIYAFFMLCVLILLNISGRKANEFSGMDERFRSLIINDNLQTVAKKLNIQHDQKQIVIYNLYVACVGFFKSFNDKFYHEKRRMNFSDIEEAKKFSGQLLVDFKFSLQPILQRYRENHPETRPTESRSSKTILVKVPQDNPANIALLRAIGIADKSAPKPLSTDDLHNATLIRCSNPKCYHIYPATQDNPKIRCKICGCYNSIIHSKAFAEAPKKHCTPCNKDFDPVFFDNKCPTCPKPKGFLSSLFSRS